MNDSFRYLIESFCKLCGLDDPQRILDGGSIIVNEVVFSLVYSEKINPELVFVYCDFGDVPLGRQADAYRALLEANLFLYTGAGPSFTVSRETGRVVFVNQYRLEKKNSADGLEAMLVQLAAKALDWRATHYLQPKTQHGTRSLSARLPGPR